MGTKSEMGWGLIRETGEKREKRKKKQKKKEVGGTCVSV
jgi:hypothetical protein